MQILSLSGYSDFVFKHIYLSIVLFNITSICLGTFLNQNYLFNFTLSALNFFLSYALILSYFHRQSSSSAIAIYSDKNIEFGQFILEFYKLAGNFTLISLIILISSLSLLKHPINDSILLKGFSFILFIGILLRWNKWNFIKKSLLLIKKFFFISSTEIIEFKDLLAADIFTSFSKQIAQLFSESPFVYPIMFSYAEN